MQILSLFLLLGHAGIGMALEWGPSPMLEDPVTVAGYPLGGDNSSVTQVRTLRRSSMLLQLVYCVF